MSKSDIEIAREASMLPVVEVGERLGIPVGQMIPYGHTKAKVSLEFLESIKERPQGKLILVTAMSPTPAGEGKTTTALALARTYALAGKRTLLIDADLRKPSLHRQLGFEPDVGFLDYLRNPESSEISGSFYARDPASPLALEPEEKIGVDGVSGIWWVNDEEVIGIYNDRQSVVDDGISKRLTLKKGQNIIRCAVINGGGATDFCARFLDADEKPLKGYTLSMGSVAN